jgi:hypothetical protein
MFITTTFAVRVRSAYSWPLLPDDVTCLFAGKGEYSLDLGACICNIGNVLPASPTAPAFTNNAYERKLFSSNQEAIAKNMVEVRPV